MGGGETYPGFPVANPTVSYWQLPPHRIAEHRTTADLPTETVFDYVIIGSGISGAAIAYKLLTRSRSSTPPAPAIPMLEARTAASGASGRNGGHCRPGRWLEFKRHVEAHGEDEALKLERLEEGTVQDIAEFVREHSVDCDFRDVETADLVATEKLWAELLEVVRFRDEVKQRRPDAGRLTQHTVWHGQQARKHLGINALVGAVTYPAHTQNPYRLVCKMLELGLEMGLNLQTNTAAVDITATATAATRGSGRWEVKTIRGTVCTRNVVFATNGFTNALHRSLAATGFLIPARNQVAAIRPGSNAAGNPAVRGSAGIDDYDHGGYFMCRAPGLSGEGDILYGGGRSVSKTRELGITDDSTVNPEIADYLHRAPGHLFGRDSWGTDGDVVRDWTGIVGYTADTQPLVGEAPGEKGLWMSVGMNGHGMAMAFRCAEALVEMMTTGSEPDWFPKPMRLERAWKNRTTSPVE